MIDLMEGGMHLPDERREIDSYLDALMEAVAATRGYAPTPEPPAVLVIEHKVKPAKKPPVQPDDDPNGVHWRRRWGKVIPLLLQPVSERTRV